MIVVPSLRKTSSNAPTNWPAPSRIRNRIVRSVAHREVAGGLGGPGAGRVRGDAGEVHAAAVEFDEEQHVVAAQHDGVDGEEVARDDPGGLGTQERRPRLRRSARCGVDARVS